MQLWMFEDAQLETKWRPIDRGLPPLQTLVFITANPNVDAVEVDIAKFDGERWINRFSIMKPLFWAPIGL